VSRSRFKVEALIMLAIPVVLVLIGVIAAFVAPWIVG
jgi:hypothetical protein